MNGLSDMTVKLYALKEGSQKSFSQLFSTLGRKNTKKLSSSWSLYNLNESQKPMEKSTSISLPPRPPSPVDPLKADLARLRSEQFKVRLERKKIEFNDSRLARDSEKFIMMLENLDKELEFLDQFVC